MIINSIFNSIHMWHFRTDVWRMIFGIIRGTVARRRSVTNLTIEVSHQMWQFWHCANCGHASAKLSWSHAAAAAVGAHTEVALLPLMYGLVQMILLIKKMALSGLDVKFRAKYKGHLRTTLYRTLNCFCVSSLDISFIVLFLQSRRFFFVSLCIDAKKHGSVVLSDIFTSFCQY